MKKVVDLNYARIRATEAKLILRLRDHSKSAFGEEAIHQAWSEFNDGLENQSLSNEDPMFRIFMPWYFFNWHINDRNDAPNDRMPLKKTVAESFLKSSHDEKSKDEEKFLLSANRRPYSLYQVLEVNPGESLVVVDLILAKITVVTETVGSCSLNVGTILLAALSLPIDGHTFFCGLAPIPLPEQMLADVREFRLEILMDTGRKLFTEKLLLAVEPFVIGFYLDAIAFLRDPDAAMELEKFESILREAEEIASSKKKSTKTKKAPSKSPKSKATFYEIKVSLNGVKPSLWRSFQLPKTATFETLHEAIQDACGWENSHLYSFMTKIGRNSEEIATSPIEINLYTQDSVAADEIKLKDFFEFHTKCAYIYDFGDNWEHKITCEAVEVKDRFKRRLTGVAGSFPPEDCGGISGYQKCLDVVAGKIEDKEGRLEWIGDWDPRSFSLSALKKSFDK